MAITILRPRAPTMRCFKLLRPCYCSSEFHTVSTQRLFRLSAGNIIIDSKFHRWLIDAQDFRNIGDYGIDTHISEADANAVCEWASEFIEQAEGFLQKHGN